MHILRVVLTTNLSKSLDSSNLINSAANTDRMVLLVWATSHPTMDPQVQLLSSLTLARY